MRRLFLSFCVMAGVALIVNLRQATPGADAPQAVSPPAFASAMDASMDTMMRAMHDAGYTGDPDVDFLVRMIPHHEAAVEMSRLELVHGTDPATRDMAGEIIAAQVTEIEGMRRRLAILRAGRPPRTPEYPALDGTRGPAR